EAEEAAQLPLGMVQDPRLSAQDEPRSYYHEFPWMARLLVVAGHQAQYRGDSRGALGKLEMVLALSRQVQNYSTGLLLEEGRAMEASAFAGLRLWLDKLGPDK